MAKDKTTDRTMYYHRFSLINIGDEEKPALNLQETLKKILESRTNTFLRYINLDHRVSYIGKYEYAKVEEKDILLFHIAFYERIPAATSEPYWNDRGACVLVYKNDMISCPCTTGISAALKHLKLLIGSNFNLIPSCIKFSPATKEDKIKLIKRDGVSYIDLNLNLCKASLEYANLKDHKTKDQIALGILGALKSLSNQNGDTDIEELTNMKVGLTFNLNHKNKQISSKQLCELGTAFINDEKRGYCIKTQSGNTITFNDLKIKKSVKVEKDGKTMNLISAWDCLKNYYLELEKSGITNE